MLLACCLGAADAQTLTTNDQGEQIVVYPDGSWRYFNEPPADPPAVPSTSPAQEEYLDPDLRAEVEARARSILRKRVQQQGKEVSALRKALKRSRKREEKELARVASLRAEGATTDRDKIEVATRRMQAARRETVALQKQLEREEAFELVLQRALPMTRERREEYFAAAGVDLSTSTGRSVGVPGAPSGAEASPTAVEPTASDGPLGSASEAPAAPARKKAKGYAEYKLEHDVRYNPPPSECVYTYQGVDEFTQKRRVDLAPAVFFAYTTPELKPYLGSNSLLTASGALVKNGGYIVLEITYTIRSQYANREFGVLPKSSPLGIKLVSGSTVTLKNQRLSQGSYDPVEKVYTYSGRYPISNRQAKTLSRGLVDQVRVMWGTGFEDYPVYEVDFFARQLSCF